MSEVKKIATRDAYGKALAELGAMHDNAVSYTHLTLPTKA